MARPLFGAALLAVAHFANSVAADSYFFPNTNGLGPQAKQVSPGCQAAIKAPLDCDPYLKTLVKKNCYEPLNNNALEQSVCKPDCGTQLAAYHADVAKACASDSSPFPGLPATYYGDSAYAIYNLTCLTDTRTGDYCTETVGKYLAGGNVPNKQLCSNCATKILDQIKSTPFHNYGNLTQRVSNVQKKCSFLPRIPVNPNGSHQIPKNTPSRSPTPKSVVPASNSCTSGNHYNVISGDTCELISEKESVATESIIQLNNLNAQCTNLQIGPICLPAACSLYNIRKGEETRCAALLQSKGVTMEKFLAWNPAVDATCSNLKAGENYCFGEPGKSPAHKCPSGKRYLVVAGDTCEIVAQKNGVDTASIISLNGLNAQCTDMKADDLICLPIPCTTYTVQSGDTCNSVAAARRITTQQFMSWNPSINSGCTNLLAGLDYCVRAPGATCPSRERYTVVSGDTCQIVAEKVGTDAESIISLNALNAQCTDLKLGSSICLPVPCKTYKVKSGDTCNAIASANGITLANFMSMNPSVDSKCSNLLAGLNYCVGKCPSGKHYTVVSGDTCQTIAEKENVATEPIMVLNGLNAQCTDLQLGASICVPVACPTYKVQQGDTCNGIAAAHGISTANFFLYNPTINSDCGNMLAGLNYCIGPDAKAPAKRTKKMIRRASAPPKCPFGKYNVISGDSCQQIAAKTNTAAEAIIAANPLINSQCTNLAIGQIICLPGACDTYIPQNGETCATVAQEHKITVKEFLIWNPYINSQCSNMFAGLSYCVSRPGSLKPRAGLSNVPNLGRKIRRATCAFGSYTVVEGDTCETVSNKLSVSTEQLILLNNLDQNCDNLILGSTVCLPQSCSIYNVQSGENCASVAQEHGLTLQQFKNLNPDINNQCSNLFANFNYCIGPPASPTKTRRRRVWPTHYADVAVAAPTPVASGTTHNCGEYYEVQMFDTCDMVSNEFMIPEDLFRRINSGIDASCSNLLTNAYYCVLPTKDWDAPPAPKQIQPAPTNIPNGTTLNCFQWYVVQQGDICFDITNQYSISVAEFQYWNPQVNDQCTDLIPGDAYCVDSPPPPAGQK
ncbi:hypothetical protein BDD12DRAFT_780083 [Trichophaea hybrida]|nr:hypothetical protein BDD12DRAFT_780083 [Trichophaea hybrida]